MHSKMIYRGSAESCLACTVTEKRNHFGLLYHHSAVDDPDFTQQRGQGELEAMDSTVGGLTNRRQPTYKNQTKTTIIDISAGYSLTHSKYVQFNNLSFMQTLAPLSASECWLVMNVNIALILVRAGLLNNCVETADERPQNRSGSGLSSSCLQKTKGARKETVHSTICDFQRKLLSVPFTGKCPWANPVPPNERYFNWCKPSLKYHKQGPVNSAAQTERPTTTLNKTLRSKLDKPWETEQSMPALLAVDAHIRFLRADSPRQKWALSGPSASIS